MTMQLAHAMASHARPPTLHSTQTGVLGKNYPQPYCHFKPMWYCAYDCPQPLLTSSLHATDSECLARTMRHNHWLHRRGVCVCVCVFVYSLCSAFVSYHDHAASMGFWASHAPAKARMQSNAMQATCHAFISSVRCSELCLSC